MKTFASIFTMMFLSVSVYAQTPLAFTIGYNTDMGFENYMQGHDEAFFTPQAMTLKGKVKSCAVEEIIPESTLKKAWDLSLSVFLYQLNYKFNHAGKIEELDINYVSRSDSQTDKIKTDVRHGFLWEGSRLKVSSFMETFLDRSFIVLMEYKPDNTVRSENWFTGWNGIFTDRLPFTVKYAYQEDGSYEVKGILEPETGKDSILKYTKHFDLKGRITHRCIYTRDLRKLIPNDPKNAETFHYEYNLDGKVFRMTYQKGDAKPVVYEYDYKDPDAHGNYRIMQVRDEYRALLYEVVWKIEYYEE